MGDFKKGYKQMRENPKVEFCAAGENGFLRYLGKAVFEKAYKTAERVFAAAPRVFMLQFQFCRVRLI